MDFLNRTFAQLSELFHSMTIGARITTALLLVAIVVSLGWLFAGRGGGPEVDLMHGMPISADQIPAMEAAFAKANLKGYEVRGTSIRVPRGQEAAYMAALADAKALPREFDRILHEALETGNVFESSKQKEQRIKFAMQQQLALIISRMSGIENAYVMYDTESRAGLNREKIVTASVSVKPVGNTQLEESKVAAIRHLVAGAIAGLKPENVTVADLNGRVYHGILEGSNGEDNLYLAVKRMYEQDLKAKILNALCFIPDVTVEPNVVLDRERMTRSRRIQHEPKTVPWREQETSSTRSREGTSPGGRVGYTAQQPNAPATLAPFRGGAREEEEETKREVQNLVSGEHIEKETVGLTPVRATVSVGIPSSYFEKVWQERNNEAGQPAKIPDRAALETIRQEESAKIQKHVAALLPPPREGTPDLNELVTVTTFQNIKLPEPPAPTTVQKLFDWLINSWTTLGLIGLVLASLVVLRAMIRSAPLAATGQGGGMPRILAPETLAASPLAVGGGEAGAAPAGAPRPHRSPTGARSPRDELSEMVREDPDAAANILRSWISTS